VGLTGGWSGGGAAAPWVLRRAAPVGPRRSGRAGPCWRPAPMGLGQAFLLRARAALPGRGQLFRGAGSTATQPGAAATPQSHAAVTPKLRRYPVNKVCPPRRNIRAAQHACDRVTELPVRSRSVKGLYLSFNAGSRFSEPNLTQTNLP